MGGETLIFLQNKSVSFSGQCLLSSGNSGHGTEKKKKVSEIENKGTV